MKEVEVHKHIQMTFQKPRQAYQKARVTTTSSVKHMQDSESTIAPPSGTRQSTPWIGYNKLDKKFLAMVK